MMKAQWSFVLYVFPHSLPPHKRPFWMHRCVVGICNGTVVCGDDRMRCAFWSISTEVEWFCGLKDKHLNCATLATFIRCNSLTMAYDVTWDRRHVQRHLSDLCECDHDGVLWTERLNLIHTKTPSFWCISPCATNPCSSNEHLPDSHSATISCFTVLCKKNMIHICFLSPISHFFTLFLFTLQSQTMAVVKHSKHEVRVFDGIGMEESLKRVEKEG